MSAPAISRRSFNRMLGVVVASFWIGPVLDAGAQAAQLPVSLRQNPQLGGWVRIDPDGTVTVFTGKAELGQGILTAVAQIAADELDVSLDKLRVVSADTARGPNEGYTYGSQSIEQSGQAVRTACAEARALLVSLAADLFALPASRLVVHDGVVTAADGRRASYWELVSGQPALLARDATGEVAPKPAREQRLVGTSVPRIDLPAKLTGEAAYVHDMRLAGMLFGRVVRPPHYGARLASAAEARVRAMPGVVAVVRNGSFLGVVARREEQAIAAREALAASARWHDAGTALPDPDRLPEALRAWRSEDSVVGHAGLSAPAPQAAIRLEASYSRPYLSQGTLGPSCAVAWLRDAHLTVWSHTQGAFPLRGELARTLGLPPGQVDVVHTPGAGCYGHNGADDAALDAALLARAVPGRPVKLQWMRDDEFAWAPFGPAMAARVRAGLSAAGRIIDWDYEVWSNSHAMRPGQPGGINLLGAWHMATPASPSPPLRIPQPFGDGDRNAVPTYALPRHRVVNHLLMETPVRNGSLRTLGAHLNVFAIESFIDELAAAAGADPVAFRLAHLEDPRARAVIEAAAKKAGWRDGAAAGGQGGRGIAYARYKSIGAYAAAVLDLQVDRASGAVRVTRATVAVDVGRIINPDGVSSQVEGGVVQAISWTLKEQVRFDERRITSRDWSTYPVLAFPEVPPIEVVLIDRPDQPSLGAGEASSGPACAALANAFASATGRRLRDLPMSPQRVLAALA